MDELEKQLLEIKEQWESTNNIEDSYSQLMALLTVILTELDEDKQTS